jgi:hypothetical protein
MAIAAGAGGCAEDGKNPCEHPNHPGIRACCGRPGENPGNCVPWSLLDQPCSGLGETMDIKRYIVCCKGLSGISTAAPNDAGACTEPFHLDPTHVCAICGNGTCGPGENRCNCPQDCF